MAKVGDTMRLKTHAYNHTYQYYVARNRALVVFKKQKRVYNNYVV